jgi:transposase InsO family protein
VAGRQPYDNAMIESFLKTLKHEEIHLSEYENYQDVIDRLDSAVGYRSPNDFEKLLLIQENNQLPRRILLTIRVRS